MGLLSFQLPVRAASTLALPFVTLVAVCSFAIAADPPVTEKPTIAFVTNQVASFWNIAEVGVKDAGEDFGVNVDVRFPSEATATKQKQIVEDLLSSGVDAVAISPIDAVNQRDMLNRWAAKIPLITHDSDAAETNRLLYIGVDNYAAGRTVGKLIKDAYPNGAKVILAIGRMEQDNSQKRQQGVIDELMDRETEFEWRDEVEDCLLYTSPSPRDLSTSRMPSSA